MDLLIVKLLALNVHIYPSKYLVYFWSEKWPNGSCRAECGYYIDDRSVTSV